MTRQLSCRVMCKTWHREVIIELKTNIISQDLNNEIINRLWNAFVEYINHGTVTCRLIRSAQHVHFIQIRQPTGVPRSRIWRCHGYPIEQTCTVDPNWKHMYTFRYKWHQHHIRLMWCWDIAYVFSYFHGLLLVGCWIQYQTAINIILLCIINHALTDVETGKQYVFIKVTSMCFIVYRECRQSDGNNMPVAHSETVTNRRVNSLLSGSMGYGTISLYIIYLIKAW